MHEFKLKGLVEGLLGQSTIKADSVKDVMELPQLRDIKNKVTVEGATLYAFVACDG